MARRCSGRSPRWGRSTRPSAWLRSASARPGGRVPSSSRGPAPRRCSGLRHPLLPEAVPNSIELAPPRGVLITGSNMSGKSTFLRTVGVNAILAQTINTCLATSYSAPVFSVRSLIGRSDDLTAGRSYYRDEVEAVLSLVRASRGSRPHLFLFDELFRGTSTIERIAAAEATLAELVHGDGRTPSPHIVIAATHDRELVALLERSVRCVPFHGQHRCRWSGIRLSVAPRVRTVVQRDSPARDVRCAAAPRRTRTGPHGGSWRPASSWRERTGRRVGR